MMPRKLQPEMDPDQKWIDAMRPFFRAGVVAACKNQDGTIDPVRTLELFCRLHGTKKFSRAGEVMEWPGLRMKIPKPAQRPCRFTIY